MAQPHYVVNVEPGPVSPAHCVASGQGLIEASAGVKAFFDITTKVRVRVSLTLTLILTLTLTLTLSLTLTLTLTKDSFGNTRLSGLEPGDHFAANIARRGGRALEWQSAASITDMENGTYRVEYMVENAGAYYMQVQLGRALTPTT